MKQTSRSLVLLAWGAIVLSQAGCIVVGGYSSTDGWSIWPGGLIISVVVILLFAFLARRRRP